MAKQLVVLSGKGGTGKTSISAGLIHISSKSMKGVYVDADVDAANLALVLNSKPLEKQSFSGGKTAFIHPEICNSCGLCFEVCRFDAIRKPVSKHGPYQVIDLLCDGCNACVQVCPQNAIRMETGVDGEWYHSQTDYGHLFHAELFPAAENTGKLVTIVKQHAKLFAQDHQIPLMIVDGPPGIGCPVISSSAGADLALIITEPGVTGLHDLERIIQTLVHFDIPIAVAVNKADIYPEGTEEIKSIAASYGHQVGSELPFDLEVPRAMLKALPITKYRPDNLVSQAIVKLWQLIETKLFNGE
jgi:MinD superfamily P-loop ATPase